MSFSDNTQAIMNAFYSSYPHLDKHNADKECVANVICELKQILAARHPAVYDDGHFLYVRGYFDCLKDLDKIAQELKNDRA